MPWKPGDHHWVPRQSEWAKEHRRLWDEGFEDVKTHLPGEEHQRAQNDEKEVGPIGSVARHDLRRWTEEFEEQGADDELDDEDY